MQYPNGGFEFDPHFNFATMSPLLPVENLAAEVPPATENFLLLDGTDFLLLNGSNFTLLGS